MISLECSPVPPPSQPGVPRAPLGPADSSGRGRPLHLLLVEDSPVAARLIHRLLPDSLREGCEVLHVERLSPALQALRRNSFDAVLLDLGLPDSEGLSTLARVIEVAPDIPIIVSTAVADEERAMQALRLGAQDYVMKEGWTGEVLGRALHYAMERKRVESRLREGEERKSAILNAALDAVVTVNAMGEVLEFNPAAERMYGLRQEDVLGASILDLIVPADKRDKYRRGLARYLATGEGTMLGRQVQMTTLRADGSEFQVELAVTAIPRINPPIFTAFIRDISARVEAEERLRESEEQYRMLFESHPHPMWVYDSESLAFLEVNAAALQHYGWTREEFLAMKVSELLPPAERLAAEEADASPSPGAEGCFLSNGGVRSHQRRDGSRIEVESASNRIRFQGRDACLVLAQDVTEQRQLSAKLIEAQKMEAIAQLAGGIAHDFNNLLTVILGFGDVLIAQTEPGNPALPALEQILAAANGAADLTRQLLTFSRKQLVQPQVLDLNASLKAVQQLIRPLMGESVELVSRPGRDLDRVEVDRGQLELLLLNLAVNARDAMSTGGRLTFETLNVDLDEDYRRFHPCVEPGRYVQLSVSDTGQGMGPETLARIFEPFFTTKQPGQGTGLGLSTVHGIVTQCGGHIAVDSEIGRGTTFRILLPRVDPAPNDERATRPDEMIGGGETVLVVEDVAQLRALIVVFLRNAGYRVLEACDGHAALAKARSHDGRIHCLLTDVVMPRGSGSELANQLSAERDDTTVLYMSGYAAEAIGKHGVIGSETHFLQKPFGRADLLRKLRQALDAGPGGPPA